MQRCFTTIIFVKSYVLFSTFSTKIQNAEIFFLKIVDFVIESHDAYFLQKRYCTNLLGFTPIQKCAAAVHQAEIDENGDRKPSEGGFRCGCDAENQSQICRHCAGAGNLRTQDHAVFLPGENFFQNLGYHKPGLLKSIPWNMIILDTLHSLLRNH